ncbi:MAG: outer membrane protein transport protein [Gammaproteobacteria bacterium]
MKNPSIAKWTYPLIAAAVVAALPDAVLASNFSLSDIQSTTNMSTAGSGGAAYAQDASTIWFNPAGLTNLNDPELTAGFNLVRLGANFSPTTAVDATGAPLSGNNGGNPGKLGATPFIYYSTPLTDKLDFGIGLGVPFGLATSYNAQSIFRYQAIYTSVTVLNLNPTLAYKFNDNWSAGFGVDIQRMDVKLTNDIDYGAVCFAEVNPVNCTALGLVPQGHDGFFQGEASDTHTGFNFGVLWQDDSTRVGFSYRSRVKHDLTGTATFTNAPALFTSQGLFQNQGINAQFTTPQIAELSWYRQLNSQWSLMADWTYTGWSSFQNLTINFSDPNQPPATVQEGLSNVSRFAVGTNYKFSDRWTFHGGVAYDKTPLPNPTAASSITPNNIDASRTARLPDANRFILAFGTSWRVSDHSQWDIGYEHLFLNGHVPFSQLDGSSGDYIAGQYNVDADILGIQYTYRF